MRHLPAFAMALALSGCAATDDPAAPTTLPVTQTGQPGAAAAACSPRAWTRLVGKRVADVRLPRGLTYRVLQAGTVVVDDYNDDRLNIVTDPAGIVIAVSCG